MNTATTSIDRPSADIRNGLVAFGAACRQVVHEHRLYLAIILVYTISVFVTGALTGTGEFVNVRFYAGTFTILVVSFSVAFVLGHAIWIAVFVRPSDSLFIAIGRDLKSHILTKQRIAGFLSASILAPLFFSTFGSYKRMIPQLNPFHWDPTFMAWDRWLHLGEHPWRLLQPVLDTPIVTTAVSFAYNLWIFVLFFTFIWQAMSCKRPMLRMQFLLGFLLTWIVLGTVLATVLSSAGPVYYGRITGLADPYAPLMTYLYNVNASFPVWALDVQERLWATYQAGGVDLGSGISAMPSLHVGTSVLFALLGWRIHRWAGIAYTVFAALILIGSVHMGWHYAIDGYVSIVSVAVLWWAVGAVLRRSERRGAA